MIEERYVVIDKKGNPFGYFNDLKTAELFVAEEPGSEIVDTKLMLKDTHEKQN